MVMSASTRPALLRARVAVYGLFLLSGMAMGTWTSRIPAIKAALGLSDGALSLGLLAIAAGAITGMQVVGRLVDRYGSYRTLLPVAVAQGLVLVLPAYMPNLAGARAVPVRVRRGLRHARHRDERQRRGGGTGVREVDHVVLPCGVQRRRVRGGVRRMACSPTPGRAPASPSRRWAWSSCSSPC